MDFLGCSNTGSLRTFKMKETPVMIKCNPGKFWLSKVKCHLNVSFSTWFSFIRWLSCEVAVNLNTHFSASVFLHELLGLYCVYCRLDHLHQLREIASLRYKLFNMEVLQRNTKIGALTHFCNIRNTRVPYGNIITQCREQIVRFLNL